MLKCWSHVPEERPTFDQLTKKLWDLEHSESSYVNLNSLLRQSMESKGKQVRYTKTQQTGAHIRWGYQLGQGKQTSQKDGPHFTENTCEKSRSYIGPDVCLNKKLFDCRDISLFNIVCNCSHFSFALAISSLNFFPSIFFHTYAQGQNFKVWVGIKENVSIII